jgi:hypothetical protein
MPDGTADPFNDARIKDLKHPFEEYLSKHDERIETLKLQKRLVSQPEEASIDFEVRVSEDVIKFMNPKFGGSDIAHYTFLHSIKGPLRDKANHWKIDPLKALLALEIRYQRGCELVWVSDIGSQVI